MSASYVFVAGVFLFLLLLRNLDSPNMSPVRAATIWVVCYYSLLTATLAIEYIARDYPLLSNLLSPVRLFTAVVQFAAMVGVFSKVRDSGDEYLSYAFWGGLGLALVFFVVPALAERLLMSL